MALITDPLQAFQYPEHIDFVYGNPTLITQYQWDPTAISGGMTFPLPCGAVISATSTSFKTAVPGVSTYGTTSTLPLGILFNRCDNASTPFSIVQPDGELVLRIPLSSMTGWSTQTTQTQLGLLNTPVGSNQAPFGLLSPLTSTANGQTPYMFLLDVQGEYALVKFNMMAWGLAN